ncbi:MAG: inositol monophosphatase [Parvibaculum sp.]|uniref:inositol monophosphatase family protein n=1 Tax=Parvibaculum sp. TaxID=2024848 RepID=UPI0025D1558A|nr:inositol monophosphatase family protein [Parvibaculum sp.]MCE9649220.1 inositol monophosphatase [Parvibaculum sp.]
MSDPMEAVAALMREVAASEILPRFRMLKDGDIEEKSKGDYVTIADREAELWLTPRLEELEPGSLVLGEEAASAEPNNLAIAQSDAPFWTVDPVDGTGNFVAGRETFGVMVAFVDKGRVRRAWIYLPVSGDLAVAEEGAGAFWHSGGKTERISSGRSPDDVSRIVGAFNVRFMAEDWRDRVELFADTVPRKSSYLCSAWDYAGLARGSHDLVTYNRMMPWDHAPGSLILREAGGVLRSLDNGLDYLPATLAAPHLAARDEESWQRFAEAIRKAS